MDKKAALFHWLFFGVLIALTIFFININTSELGSDQVRGAWHIGTIWAFQDLQIKQLEQDNEIREIAYQTRVNLPIPEYFGCGTITDKKIPLLNDGARWCNVFLQNIFLDNFKINLGDLYEKYSDILLSEEYVIGVAKELQKEEQDKLSIPMGGMNRHIFLVPPFRRELSYNPSFRINLGTKLDEFQQFQIKASPLLGACRGNEDLRVCINNYDLPESWHRFHDCYNDIEPQDNKVSFCVGINGQLYNFALDFNE